MTAKVAQMNLVKDDPSRVKYETLLDDRNFANRFAWQWRLFLAALDKRASNPK
jgi:hypothetical protein